MNPEVMALLQWFADSEQLPTNPQQLIERLRTDAEFRRLVANELHMQGKLQAVQSTEPRWLELQAILESEILDSEIKCANFDDRVMLQIATHQSSAPPPLSWRIPLVVIFAMAATIVIAIFAVMPSLSQPQPQPSAKQELTTDEMQDNGVALISSSAGAVWANRPELATGSILPRGELTLEQGFVEITFYHGARVIVEAPAKIKLETENSAICYYGKMRAQVPQQAHGFSIKSAQFDLVDIGTEFGVDVAPTGEAKVHVFVGEVQLFAPDGKRSSDSLRRVVSGNGVAWAASGVMTDVISTPFEFTSFDEVRDRQVEERSQRYAAWRLASQTRSRDPRLVSYFDFEQQGHQLVDHGMAGIGGTIVSGGWVEGRWPGKGALEFNRASDRVRLDVPGEFDALTLAAWIRLDALPSRRQALLLTDGYKDGRIHWQIYPGGELRFGFRYLEREKIGKIKKSYGHTSPVLFTANQIGNWNFVCTVYERKTRSVTHYFNGHRVSREVLPVDQIVQLGPCELGNWEEPVMNGLRAVRNFIGRMDEVSIWKTALSDNEISDLYQNARP